MGEKTQCAGRSPSFGKYPKQRSQRRKGKKHFCGQPKKPTGIELEDGSYANAYTKRKGLTEG